MPSNFTGFDVLIDNDDGTTTPVASHAVHVYDATHSVALADVATDASGHVASGTLAAITLASRVAPPGTPAGCVAGPIVFVPPICFSFRSLAGRCAPALVYAGALPDGATRERPGP